MKDSLKDKRICISGSGNVATFAAIKATQLGAKVISFSDSGGVVFENDGFDMEALNKIMILKTEQRKRISEWTKQSDSAR